MYQEAGEGFALHHWPTCTGARRLTAHTSYPRPLELAPQQSDQVLHRLGLAAEALAKRGSFDLPLWLNRALSPARASKGVALSLPKR